MKYNQVMETLTNGNFILISGASNVLPRGEKVGTYVLKQELEALGYPSMLVTGRYAGYTEDSLLVAGLPYHIAKQLAVKYGQESFIEGKSNLHSSQSLYRMVFVSGPDAGKVVWSKTFKDLGLVVSDTQDFTRVYPSDSLNINFHIDFDTDFDS